MIAARCRTNLDSRKHEDWPTVFAAVPRIGDRVRARSGHTLKVVSITHLVLFRDVTASGHVEPGIIVELNK